MIKNKGPEVQKYNPEVHPGKLKQSGKTECWKQLLNFGQYRQKNSARIISALNWKQCHVQKTINFSITELFYDFAVLDQEVLSEENSSTSKYIVLNLNARDGLLKGKNQLAFSFERGSSC